MAAPKSFKDIDARNQAVLDRIVSTDYPTHCRFKDISGNDYGYLHVDKYYGKDARGQLYYWCTCKCGNKILVRNTHLMYGDTLSCGCRISEADVKRNKENTKHGGTGTRLHDIWTGMCQRCFNPKCDAYYNYGGRGITICHEWRNLDNGFINFRDWAYKNGYTDKLTIDRIDVDGNYCPENCRWVSQKVQANNRRVTVYLRVNRFVFPLTIWSEITGISKETLWSRHMNGWTDSQIVLTPSGGDKSKPYVTMEIPPEMEIYNKYDEWVTKGYIHPEY